MLKFGYKIERNYLKELLYENFFTNEYYIFLLPNSVSTERFNQVVFYRKQHILNYLHLLHNYKKRGGFLLFNKVFEIENPMKLQRYDSKIFFFKIRKNKIVGAKPHNCLQTSIFLNEQTQPKNTDLKLWNVNSFQKITNSGISQENTIRKLFFHQTYKFEDEINFLYIQTFWTWNYVNSLGVLNNKYDIIYLQNKYFSNNYTQIFFFKKYNVTYILNKFIRRWNGPQSFNKGEYGFFNTGEYKTDLPLEIYSKIEKPRTFIRYMAKVPEDAIYRISFSIKNLKNIPNLKKNLYGNPWEPYMMYRQQGEFLHTPYPEKSLEESELTKLYIPKKWFFWNIWKPVGYDNFQMAFLWNLALNMPLFFNRQYYLSKIELFLVRNYDALAQYPLSLNEEKNKNFFHKTHFIYFLAQFTNDKNKTINQYLNKIYEKQKESYIEKKSKENHIGRGSYLYRNYFLNQISLVSSELTKFSNLYFKPLIKCNRIKYNRLFNIKIHKYFPSVTPYFILTNYCWVNTFSGWSNFTQRIHTHSNLNFTDTRKIWFYIHKWNFTFWNSVDTAHNIKVKNFFTQIYRCNEIASNKLSLVLWNLNNSLFDAVINYNNGVYYYVFLDNFLKNIIKTSKNYFMSIEIPIYLKKKSLFEKITHKIKFIIKIFFNKYNFFLNWNFNLSNYKWLNFYLNLFYQFLNKIITLPILSVLDINWNQLLYKPFKNLRFILIKIFFSNYNMVIIKTIFANFFLTVKNLNLLKLIVIGMSILTPTAVILNNIIELFDFLIVIPSVLINFFFWSFSFLNSNFFFLENCHIWIKNIYNIEIFNNILPFLKQITINYDCFMEWIQNKSKCSNQTNLNVNTLENLKNEINKDVIVKTKIMRKDNIIHSIDNITNNFVSCFDFKTILSATLFFVTIGCVVCCVNVNVI